MIDSDERFLRDEELEAAIQQDLAVWRAIQDQPDYLSEAARYLGRGIFDRRASHGSRARHSI